MNKAVDAYIKQQTPWQQQILHDLRQAIHTADPEIEESIKWGTPAFEHAGHLAWFFCAKEWVHFSFPNGALLDHSHGLFEATETRGQRTIKFRESDKVPVTIIIKLVKQAVANNIAGKKMDFKIPKKGEQVFDVPREYETFLKENSVWEAYQDRPYYQQKGWIQWIEQAKQQATHDKRKQTMVRELQHNQYMPNKADRK